MSNLQANPIFVFVYVLFETQNVWKWFLGFGKISSKAPASWLFMFQSWSYGKIYINSIEHLISGNTAQNIVHKSDQLF